MAFLSGRVTFERFAVVGETPAALGDNQIGVLEKYAIGRSPLSTEGIEVGFAGGEHILDLDFSAEKLLVNDALAFAIRIDTNRVPGDLKRAYTLIELGSLMAENPSGFPSRKQKLEAKERAEERLADEARTGRFRRIQMVPVLWDARQSMIYLGSTSATVAERFAALFTEAFDLSLRRVTSGVVAEMVADEKSLHRALEDVEPSGFSGTARPSHVHWVASEASNKDFLGNEFLLWLWWLLETQSDSVKLADDSVATCYLSRTLSLEDPEGETGKETINSDAPTRLPEAREAVINGKWPRKTGLTLVRHDEEYALTLIGDSLAVGSAQLPRLEGESPQSAREARVDQIRHLSETLDLVYGLFCRRRLSSTWQNDLSGVRGWLREAA